MKVIMHMAISIDGFIARTDGDTSWVSSIDLNLFQKRATDAGCIFVGRTTFNEIYPIKGVMHIVLTDSKDTKHPDSQVAFVSSTEKAVALAKEKGFETVMLVGGGKTNGSFFKAGLIDEMFLTVHPIVLNYGIHLFGNVGIETVLQLIDTKELGEGLVQLHYKK